MPASVIERRVSDRAFVGHYVAAAVAGAIVLAVLFLTSALLALPFLIVLAPLPCLAVFGWTRLQRAGSVYRLYPDRLEIESGILVRKIENVDLFRVRDVGLRQGVLGRMADVGDVYIHSTDSSTPDVHVRAIDAPKDFYQELREAVARNRARGRTMIVESERAVHEE